MAVHPHHIIHGRVSAGVYVPVKVDADGIVQTSGSGGGGGGGDASATNQATQIAQVGATTDAGVVGDNSGSLSAKSRGLNTMIWDMWDSVLHLLRVQIVNATLAVTQSGSWVISAGSALIGKVGIDQTTPGTTNKVTVGSDVVHVIVDSGVTSGLTDTQLRATAVPVSGTVTATGPLTDAQLRATAVPVSGTVTANAGTNLNTSALALDTTLVANGVLIGPVTETAPITDIASSGLNGRLQRIAQRITSLITALGSPFQAGASIGNTTFASTVANGANAVEGTTTDAKVVTDATGTIQQYLRGLVTFFANSLGAGTAAAAHRTTLASDDPAVATLGATTGTKVVTDANGSIQQYLRGIVTFLANALGAGTAAAANRVTLASDDPAVATLGAISGAKVVTDANGTLQQYLRGLVTFYANALGAGTAAAAIRYTLASDDPAVATLGATTGTKVVTDANGTIQQYLRGIVTFLANALGAGTAAAANRVTLASDDPAVATLGAITGAAVITDANGTIQQYLRGIIKLAITVGGWLVTIAGIKIDYAASSALTQGIGSLASSSTFVAGWETGSYNNSSNKYPTVGLSGTIMTGTTPTAGEIQVWVVAALDDTPTWPDVFDGTSSVETVTSAAILQACGRLAARMITSTTSNQAYPFAPVDVRSLFGGFMPKQFVVFVTHSTVAALHATAGNHVLTVTPMMG